MCKAQLTDSMMDSRVLTVHPMGERATGRRARPIFRMAALQLLAKIRRERIFAPASREGGESQDAMSNSRLLLVVFERLR